MNNKVEAAYNAAADSYDDSANSFWERFGRKTIVRVHLKPGSRVMDVCCGSGASALPAAEIVAPAGFVKNNYLLIFGSSDSNAI